MNIPTIMDLTVLSPSFPKIEHEIDRPHFLDTIQHIFETQAEIIFLEGIDGIGKTVLAAQFAKRFPNNSLSSFVSYKSSSASDPEVIKDVLYEQLIWAFDYRSHTSRDFIADAMYNIEISRLSRKAQRENSIYYFILDGLDEFPADSDQQRVKEILSMLPFGQPNFRFLVTGDSSTLTSLIESKTNSKPFHLSGFSLAEATRYLDDLALDEESISELHSLAQKVPGYLASIRRSLQTGTKVEDILVGTGSVPDFFDFEWAKIDSDDSVQKQILSIIAHNNKNRDLAEIADILQTSSDKVQEKVIHLPFITEFQDGTLGYVTGAFRAYAARKLSSLERETNNLLIDHLFAVPESISTLTEIPVYLERTERYEELLTYLTYDHFAKLINLVQSLIPLKHQLDLGVMTAAQLGRDRDLLRLSFESATLEQFSKSATWRAELEARTALDDFDSACAIAQSIPLREERLHAFAVIARKARESGLPVRGDVSDQIKSLYDEIDKKGLGEKALDIASDLIFSFHELAIDLVEKAADVSKGDNALDWSLANLTVSALRAGASEHEQLNMSGADATESIKNKVHDPKVQNFISTASLLFKETPASIAIRDAEKIEGAGDRLFVLRQWTKNNRKREDAPEVIEYALKLAIGTTPYTFNATVLRELALPLPEIKNPEQLRKLIGLIESQIHTAESLGPTEDFIRLHLVLARAESRLDLDFAHERMVETFLRVTYLPELEIKTACLAWFLGSLEEIDPQRVWESPTSGSLHSSAKDTFDIALDQLLTGSANHFEVTKSIIQALARFLPQLGLDVALRLNVAPRRDRALIELYRGLISHPFENIDFEFLHATLSKFDDSGARDYAVGIIMSRLSTIDPPRKTVDPGLKALFGEIVKMKSIQEKVLAGCRAYRLLIASEGDSGLGSKLLTNVMSDWAKENQGWHRLTLGFQMTAILAKVNRTVANEIFDSIERIREEIPMDSPSTIHAYTVSVRLAIRAFHGILRQKQFKEERLIELQRLIEVLPSDGDQAILYAEISLLFRFNDEDALSRRIVDEKVRPKIDQIQDEAFRNEVIVNTAPALYLAHTATAMDLILNLPTSSIDDAIENITSVILTKTMVSEPFETRTGQTFELTYPEIVDLCSLAKRIDADSQLYTLIQAIASSIAKHRNRISRQQTALVLSELQQIIDAKLPNPRHIQHEGYKIIAETELAKLKDVPRSEWEKLVERARQIPNIADRTYTLACVAENIKAKEKDLKRNVFREARALIEQIPALYDRIDRYKIIAEFNLEGDEGMTKECIAEAFNITLGTNDTELLSRQRKLVDLAFRIDPSFAASMSALIDDDPAKKPMKHMLNQQIEAAKLEKRMSEAKHQKTSLSDSEQRNAPAAAWKNLGSLNAGRITTQRPEGLRDWLKAVHKMPINQAYPVFAYFIQNTVMRPGSVHDVSSLAAAVFDSTLQNCRLSGLVASQSSDTFRKSLTYSSVGKKDQDYIVGLGERKEVIKYLKRWSTESLGDYIKIADPFFGPDDLDLLQLDFEAKPSCKIWVLTSQKHNQGSWDSLEETYLRRWRTLYNQEPPDAEIVFIGLEETGASPIHDRWWLTSERGLRLGTSFNSIGEGKVSEISSLDNDSSAAKEAELDKYLFRIVREHQGKKVSYKTISFQK